MDTVDDAFTNEEPGVDFRDFNDEVMCREGVFCGPQVRQLPKRSYPWVDGSNGT